MKVNKLAIIALIITLVTLTNITLAATVEPIKLSSQLHEGDKVSFNLNIKIEEGDKKLTIETSLVPIDDKPLYDFGDANRYITENRYNQKITLNLTGAESTLPVNISGAVPYGETKIPVKSSNSDIILTKFIDTELKYYEVHANQLAGIETFQLIINRKEKFENTLKAVRRQELDSIKSSARRLFDIGLVTEAQDIADKLTVIQFPDSLTLLELIKIDNDMTLNAIYLISIVVFFGIGFKLGSSHNGGEYEEEQN